VIGAWRTRWRSWPAWSRTTTVVVVVVVAFNAVAFAGDVLTGGSDPSGPRSSSYATAPDGVAAYAALLAVNGHPVDHLRQPVVAAPASLRASTLILLDAGGVSAAEARAIRSNVRAGMRLVTSDFGGDDRLDSIVDPAPSWSPRRAVHAAPTLPVMETAGVATVRGQGAGTWSRPGGGLPVLADHGRPFTLTARVGKGTVVLLADSSPLTNHLLAHASNATFGVDIAGEVGRPVVFDEAVHGYGTRKGFASLPPRWKATAMALLAAVVMWMVASARRLGPPERTERELPPPRRAYVDALASTLARTRSPDAAMEPVRAAARAAIVRRRGLAPDAPASDLAAGARAIGLTEDEIAAVVDGAQPATTMGRALARLTGSRS